MTINATSNSEAETTHLAAALGACLRGGDVIALSGDLGAGKTRFVRGLAQGLGLNPTEVSSPTYVICRQYTPAENQREQTENHKRQSNRLTLIHVDAYRIDAEQTETIGFDEMLEREDAVIAVEWPGRIDAALPSHKQMIRVQLDHASENARQVEIVIPANFQDRFAGFIESMQANLKVESHCQICHKPLAEGSRYFPFCSKRCRLVDLSRWFGGQYSLNRPIEDDDQL